MRKHGKKIGNELTANHATGEEDVSSQEEAMNLRMSRWNVVVHFVRRSKAILAYHAGPESLRVKPRSRKRNRGNGRNSMSPQGLHVVPVDFGWSVVGKPSWWTVFSRIQRFFRRIQRFFRQKRHT